MVPFTLAGWSGVLAGAFIAFFAFIGFETLANLAEEVKDAQRTVPRGIIGAVAASSMLYVLVATAVVLADRTGGNPLLGLFEGRNVSLFAAIGSIAVANGVLVQIIMLARLFYGMASNGQLPAALGRVHRRTRTPVVATAIAGAIVLVVALIVPFAHLLVFDNAVTLIVFALVDLALCHVQRREPAVAGTFTVARWVPPTAAILAVGLLLAEVLV